MIVIDIEATGLDHEKCSLFSIGAVEFENPDNRFYEECNIDEGAEVQDKALELLGIKNEDLHDSKKQTSIELMNSFIKWSDKIADKTFAGASVQYDYYWFERANIKGLIKFHPYHRLIEIHTLTVAKYLQLGLKVPMFENYTDLGLTKTSRFCGIPDERKVHNALGDAILETEVMYRLIYGVNKIEEFKRYPVPEYLISSAAKMIAD